MASRRPLSASFASLGIAEMIHRLEMCDLVDRTNGIAFFTG
jgi:hypothetical protein